MPRQERTKSGTGIYHVMLRGINRQDIFEDDEDYLQMTSIKTKMITEPSLGHFKVAQGPVIINNANVTVKATQGATITKDFEVQLGATFTITN